MGLLSPRYRGPTGVVSGSPLDVAGSPPTVDLGALARLFVGPGLYGEFAPASYWTDVELLRSTPPIVRTDTTISEAFETAVADMCGDSEAVGVKVSGGLDSLAVLWHVTRLRPRRRVVAYCVDLVDDAGVRSSTIVKRRIDLLATDVELTIVEPAMTQAVDTVFAWSPLGPRLDALPTTNVAIADLAVSNRLDVLLTGDGADELLAVPRYATRPIARHLGIAAARQYLADIRRSGPGLAGEILAFLGDGLPARTRSRWYWAANWPDWCSPAASPVLMEPFDEQAGHWADQWVAETIAAHVDAGRTWAAADAYDSFWPHTPIPAAGPVPEGSPFLHDAVLTASPPIHERYDPAGATAYQRCKAAIVMLLPSHVRKGLPRRKSYYSKALQALQGSPPSVPIAAAAGLLDPGAIAAANEVAVVMNGRAVEEWLAGAVANGHTVPGVNSAKT